VPQVPVDQEPARWDFEAVHLGPQGQVLGLLVRAVELVWILERQGVEFLASDKSLEVAAYRALRLCRISARL
jgi:hypothetical protein